MGAEKYPDDGIEEGYDRDNYHQAYHKVEILLILHCQTNLLNPFISLQNFRIDFTSYVFDLSKQKPAISSQPIRLEFKFGAAFIVAHYVAYDLVLTPKVINISSDGQTFRSSIMKIFNPMSKFTFFILKTARSFISFKSCWWVKVCFKFHTCRNSAQISSSGSFSVISLRYNITNFKQKTWTIAFLCVFIPR